MPFIKNERHYNSAPITDLASTDVAPLAVIPAALGDTAGRAEVQGVLAALEGDLSQVATKVNLILNALEEAGIVAR